MRALRVILSAALIVSLAAPGLSVDGNRLTYLDDPSNPYWVGLDLPKLTTPQWIGEPGVELAIVLAMDDVRATAPVQPFLSPIVERLKKIDGRAPLSLMTNRLDPQDPLAQAWLKNGTTFEAHTYDHPCPLLGGTFEQAKETYDRCVDLLASVPGARPVAFRMPCYDSRNTVSPRFYTEIFSRTTPQGHFCELCSSVFCVFSAGDPSLPSALLIDEEGRPRFSKYILTERRFVNMVDSYPYPYVIARLCWQIPPIMPDDCVGKYLTRPADPNTVRDMKAAIDATAAKQGIYTLCFHPHGWVTDAQVVDLIDHATTRHAGKVRFLSFRDVRDRLTEHLLGGQPLRRANGQDNGVRVLDLNADGFMDVVIGNPEVRQTRLWSPESHTWTVLDFPAQLITVDAENNSRDAGVRFGVLLPDGKTSFLVRNESAAGLWHFDGSTWVQEPAGLEGLRLKSAVVTSAGGRDRGVRFRDLDGDGQCEVVVANPQESGTFAWSAASRRWERLPFALPTGTTIVDARGGDAGLRFVDIDADGRADVVFSNADRYSADLFTSMEKGWSRRILAGEQGKTGALPPVVRDDGSNNGVWFARRHLWVQNEDTGTAFPFHVDSRSFEDDFLAGRKKTSD